MSAESLLAELTTQGIHVESRPGGSLYVAPKCRLTPELVKRIRHHRQAIFACLTHVHRAAHDFNVAANSRQQLIPPEVRIKIGAIEAEASAKGWPQELLWNAGYWDRPRGLASLLDCDDEIVEVTGDEIAILKCRRDIQRFRRNVS
jgi:hypothetical protein